MDIPEDVLDRFRKRDKLAFSIVYDRFSGPLFGLILKIVQEEGQAQDVL